MIQRIQSVYLLIAALCCLGMTFLDTPWYKLNGQVPNREDFNITIDYTFTQFRYWNDGELYREKENTKMMLGLLLTAVLAFIAIFLFKNPTLQILACYGVILGLLAVLALVGYYWYSSRDWLPVNPQGSIQATIGLWFVPLVMVVLAIRGIQADINLLRSADRLRE